MAVTKTNVVRILEQAKIDHKVTTYDTKDGKIDGEAVAKKLNQDVNGVYKTLVLVGHSKEVYVFVIPVCEELDLKKASKCVGEKSIDMLHLKDLQKTTGYIRGGCSPIGMKKSFKTIIEIKAKSRDDITVSGGKIGVQVTLSPEELVNYIKGQFGDVCK